MEGIYSYMTSYSSRVDRKNLVSAIVREFMNAINERGEDDILSKKFSSLMGIPDNDDFSIFVLVNNKGYYDIFMTFEAFTPIGDVLKEDKLIKQLGVSNEESYVLENISREDATEFIKALYLYDRRPDFNSSRETNAPIPVKNRHNFLINNDAFSISDLEKVQVLIELFYLMLQ